MALVPGTLPTSQTFPGTPQALLNLFAQYLSAAPSQRTVFIQSTSVGVPTDGTCIWFNTGTNTLNIYSGSSWSTPTVASGSINAGSLGNGAVGTANIASGAITNALIASGTIQYTRLSAGAPTWNTTGTLFPLAGVSALGAITTTTGDISTSSGNISTSSGNISASGTITAGTGITATTGNIAASAGNISASGTITSTGSITTLGSVTAASLIIAGTSPVAAAYVSFDATPNPLTSVSMLYSGTTITATKTAHGLSAGDSITITSGTGTTANYNGTWVVLGGASLTANSFTFAVTTAPTAALTATIYPVYIKKSYQVTSVTFVSTGTYAINFPTGILSDSTYLTLTTPWIGVNNQVVTASASLARSLIVKSQTTSAVTIVDTVGAGGVAYDIAANVVIFGT